MKANKKNLERVKLLARDLRDGKQFPRSPRDTYAGYVLAARARGEEPTEVLRAALGLAATHAAQAARFRPARPGDELPAVADLFRTELQHRGEL